MSLTLLNIYNTLFLIVGGHGDYDYGDDYFYYGDEHSFNTILSFDVTNQVWTEVGHMNINRFAHAVSVVNAKDVIQYCIY